jgi:choline monooxygenase
MSEEPLATLLAGYDESAPLEAAYTIPSGWYTSEAVAKLEREAVFARSWQLVFRADQVARAGEFATAEIAGEPILAVRGADGVLRAFFNVCRHHAAAVATTCEGRAERFRCPYHGWTYSLEGELLGAPEFQQVTGFDRNRNGLVPVPVGEWEQFVFVNLDEGAAPLSEWLGELRAGVAPRDLASLCFFARREYTLACNWKVYVDNYLDGGYHVRYLHIGLNSVLDYREYTIENGPNFCLQTSPIADSGSDAAVSATRRGERAWYYWLYPSFMLNVYEGVMDTNLVLPMGVDRTKVIFDFYFKDVSAGAAEKNEASVAVGEKIQREDEAICESVQRGLGSRAYRAGRLSVRREAGEWLFHRLLKRELGRGLQKAGKIAENPAPQGRPKC